MEDKIIISLGSSCDPANQLKRLNVNKNYQNFVFFHHDTSKIETIKSFNRKIIKTREVLKSPKKKFFIYYRHYHWDEVINSIFDK
tara:strand:+ start:634 stop:888 length:255 start_codon:yes stop_codon:yes gene_type:complete